MVSIFWYIRCSEIQKEIDKTVEEEDYVCVCVCVRLGRGSEHSLVAFRKCGNRENVSHGSAPKGGGERFTADNRRVGAQSIIIKNVPIPVLTRNSKLYTCRHTRTHSLCILPCPLTYDGRGMAE